MNNNKKNVLIAIIVILTIIVLVLVGYIGYDKFSNNDQTLKTQETKQNEVDNKTEVIDTKENESSSEVSEVNDYIKTRICTGFYSGIAALTEDKKAGEYTKGILTIELKKDGTYNLTKENIDSDSGLYTIIDNTLLLKTAPHICGPGMDCSFKYSQYLTIDDDCSSISWGYGSYFFDPDFTLNKQN